LVNGKRIANSGSKWVNSKDCVKKEKGVRLVKLDVYHPTQRTRESKHTIKKENGKMRLNEFQELSKRTAPKPVSVVGKPIYTRDSIVNYIMGLSGETGEFIDQVKKEWYHGNPKDQESKKKELGDILHYWVILCDMFGFTAEEVATGKFVEIAKALSEWI
jgi:NTP pyrophosphatase (non-canonical NTP hydrolase)